ncbi:TPA: hypothetical protein ACYSCR_005685, partial [Klebsiella oxytoca]
MSVKIRNQHVGIITCHPKVKSDEDEKINYAYTYFEKRLEKQEACKLLNKSKKGVRYSEEE